MKKENESTEKLELTEIDEEIKKQQKTVNLKKIEEKKGITKGVISENPKATLAVAGLVLAVLVIGMMMAFGGVGMINGAILGKVVLTAATAGTALYGASKLYKAIRGDKDQNNLNSLIKVRKGIQRAEAKKKLQSAQEALDQKLQFEKDNQLVGRLLSGSEYEAGEVKYKDAKGRDQTQKISELSEQQQDLYKLGKTKKDDSELKKQLEEAQKEAQKSIEDLSKTKIKTADKQLQDLVTKLGVTDFDKDKTGANMVTQIDNVADKFKTSNDNDLDLAGGSANKDILKEILRACAGVGSDGNKIGADKTDYLDGKSRLAILTSLREALDGADTTKFKADAAGNDTSSTKLSEIQKKVSEEKEKTIERAGKRNGQAKAMAV